MPLQPRLTIAQAFAQEHRSRDDVYYFEALPIKGRGLLSVSPPFVDQNAIVTARAGAATFNL